MIDGFNYRVKNLQDVGLNYPDNILAFKLLKNCNVSEEAQSTVFAALQSRTDPSVEDLLLHTMICLNKILLELETSKPEIKVEDAEVKAICQGMDRRLYIILSVMCRFFTWNVPLFVRNFKQGPSVIF